MLLPQLGAVLATGLVLQAAATPLTHSVQNIPRRFDAQGLAKRVVPDTHVLHERQLPQWIHKWKRGAKVPREALLPMRIGLKQRNLEEGAKLLRDISHPSSPSYGRHLSSDEVVEMFAPAQASVDAVIEWLVSSGISEDRISQSANKQWIQFDAKAHEVEEIMVADFYIFEHSSTGTKNVAVDEYHLPKDIQEHVDFITPGIKMRTDPRELKKMKKKRDQEHMVALNKKRGFQPTNTAAVASKGNPAAGFAYLPEFDPKSLTLAECDAYVTAACMREVYQIPNNTLAAEGNELGIFESLDDHYSKYDLDAFFSTLYPYIPNGTYPIEKNIDGAVGSIEEAGIPEEDAGVESDLDFQASWPLIWPQKTVLFQTDDQYYEINQTSLDTPYFGFYNTFFDALDGSYCTYSAYGETGDCTAAECLDPTYPDPNGYQGQLQCGVYEPTNVISISYGGGESDLPAYYLERQCNEILKLGLQGTTVVMSSGDYGVGSYPGDFGYETGCAGPDGTVFYPDADATCPYVLAVGSTQYEFANNDTSSVPYEVSTSRFASGGGFSNYFSTPSWQQSAVDKYFSEVTLNFTGYTEAGTNFSDVGDGVYHIGGRGYPDVSAIGDYFVLYTEGGWYQVGGTSLSSPVWGSVLTLVNEHRLAANKSTVGFIHEILYNHTEVFNDVTSGSNPNCDSTGFLAAEGWDPVSGLGTPNFPKLLSLLLSV